jgi:hypothetical protein
MRGDADLLAVLDRHPGLAFLISASTPGMVNSVYCHLSHHKISAEASGIAWKQILVFE